MSSPAGPPLRAVRVALVGSQYDMVARLAERLDSTAQIEVVGRFPTRQAAVAGVDRVDADVVVVDASLPDGPAAEVCADLRAAGGGRSCLVLSGLPLPDGASDHAIDAVVLKSLTHDVLEQEILRLAGRTIGPSDEAVH